MGGVPMDAKFAIGDKEFIHQQKLENYRRLIAECENAVTKNEIQPRWLLKLLADEEAKDIEPPERLQQTRSASGSCPGRSATLSSRQLMSTWNAATMAAP
jgi:hypothetical protein